MLSICSATCVCWVYSVQAGSLEEKPCIAAPGSGLLKRFGIWLVLFYVLAAVGKAASPKSDPPATGVLEGRLTDAQSVPLAEATVVLRNLDTGATSSGLTGKNGSYRFAGLGPGEYRIEAEVPSLGKGAVDGILISAGHATRVQAALAMQLPERPALADEQGLGTLDPIAPAVTTMIDREELDVVPVISRDWSSFLGATPASGSTGQGEHGGGQIGEQAGGQGDAGDSGLDAGDSVALKGNVAQAAISIDGMDTTPAFHRVGTGADVAGESLGESAVTSLEARSEVTPADRSNSTGGAVNLTSAHGGEGLHGQAFYFNRDNFWAAQNPYTQWVRQTAAATGTDIAQFDAEPYSPANGRQTFGIGVGSQIRRNKLFWFAALDGLRTNNGAVATVRHPEEFFARPSDPELTVLAARLDVGGPDVIEQAVADYSAGLGHLAGLLGPVARTSSQWKGFGRIDWQMTERQHLSIEGDAAKLDAPGGSVARASETYGSHSFGNSKAEENWGQVRLESFLTANLLNAVGVDYRRHVQGNTAEAPSDFEKPLIANAWGQLPEIIAGSRNGFILGKPARLGGSRYPDERSFVAQETLSWVRGAHLLKVGGSFDHVSDYVNTLVNQTGTYSYADVLNFVSDEASFNKYGLTGVGSPLTGQHNCDATGRISRLAGGQLTGLGYLPCYAWYSQRIGPSDWHLSTNDFAGFFTEQWQPLHNLTLSAGMRAQAEQLPPPIATVTNIELPATEKLPPLAWNYGPRFGLAWSPLNRTVLRMGAGLYYGRIDNSVTLAALTQTGSVFGDLNFFFKPNDDGAPPFPYVFSSEPTTVVTPGAVSFASNFKQQEIEQAVVSLEQGLPSHWLISVSAMASLGRRLPISIDTNLERAVSATGEPATITYSVVDAIGAGPIKTPKLTVPLFSDRLNMNYQQLDSIESRANSTYDAAMVRLIRYGSRGFSLHAHYLYAHATDWNPNESGQVSVDNALDPTDFEEEYGTSNLDIRHSGGATLLYQTPWKMRGAAGYLGNAWSIAAVGQYRSGLPFTMRTGGYIPGYYNSAHELTDGVGPGMNGSGGDNRIYGIGRNTYRYPGSYTGDARLGKRFYLPNHRELELLAESFNLFNHQNVTLLETTGYTINRGSTSGGPPTLNFLTGLTKAGLPSTVPEFGKPLDVNATNFYRPREFQVGVRARF
jgi:hypothetical protein